MVLRAVQPSNAESPSTRSVPFSAKTISWSAVQSSNAPEPTEVTLAGSLTEASDTHL